MKTLYRYALAGLLTLGFGVQSSLAQRLPAPDAHLQQIYGEHYAEILDKTGGDAAAWNRHASNTRNHRRYQNIFS